MEDRSRKKWAPYRLQKGDRGEADRPSIRKASPGKNGEEGRLKEPSGTKTDSEKKTSAQTRGPAIVLGTGTGPRGGREKPQQHRAGRHFTLLSRPWSDSKQAVKRKRGEPASATRKRLLPEGRKRSCQFRAGRVESLQDEKKAGSAPLSRRKRRTRPWPERSVRAV